MLIDVKTVNIIVSVPRDYFDIVKKAACDAGAGNMGNYAYCSISSKILGSFIPTEEATPFIGETGQVETVEEYKLEMKCKIEDVKPVIKAIKKVHPYEEVGINIYPLIDEEDLEWDARSCVFFLAIFLSSNIIALKGDTLWNTY